MMRKLGPALVLCMAVTTAAFAGTAFWAPLSGNTAGHARLLGTGINETVTVDPTLVNRPFTTEWAAQNPTSGLLDAGNGRYNVLGNIGRHKGVLTNDAGDWLKLDDTQAYTFYASWDLPPSPLSNSAPAPTTGTVSSLNARMYAGPNTGWTYFTSGAGLQLDAGLEWETANNRWIIDSDQSGDLGKKTPIAAPFSHFEIFYTFTPPATYAVEYSLDYGPRTAVAGSPLNLAGYLGIPAYAVYLTAPDAIQTSYRGDAARNFYAYASGGGVPTAGNGGAGDADGDGTSDMDDAFPTNGSYAADTDHDVLPDEWEQDSFGNLDETPEGDADDDGFTNLVEFEEGTDPIDPGNYPGLPIAGLAGLLGLGAVLAAGGVRALRKR